MELVQGRPADWASRLPKEIRVYDLLDSLGVSYQRIDHEAAMTMEACAEVDKVLDAVICKNLLLCNRQHTAFYLLMIAGDKHFKTSALSKQIGSSRLSFAEPDMEAFPCLRMAREAAAEGGTACAILNGANEEAVRLFLEGKIGFNDIPRRIAGARAAVAVRRRPTLEEILEADRAARYAVLA